MDKVFAARVERDVVREALVSALKGYELPEEIRQLLQADEAATDRFRREWMEYQAEAK